MNTEEFEKAIEINISTIKKYEKDFKLNIPRNELNHRVYGEPELKIYQWIKEQFADGKSIADIQKKMEVNTSDIPVTYQQNTSGISDNISNISPEKVEAIEQSMQSFKGDISEVKSLIEGQNNNFIILQEQSKSMSELTYRLGTTEAELKAEREAHFQTKERHESEKRIISQYSDKTVQDMKAELEAKNLEIEKLKAELEKEQSKSFFQKVFNSKKA